MKKAEVSRATLSRIPAYLQYLKGLPQTTRNTSATVIAKELGLGEVQVRKDLGALCGAGKPKVGYEVARLAQSLEGALDCENSAAVIVGAGRLGKALLDYEGFEHCGVSILAAFDSRVSEAETSGRGKPILPMAQLEPFCRERGVGLGILAVPAQAAQTVCNQLCDCGIKGIWCFAPCQLYKPEDVVIQYENLATSLTYLKMQIK